MADINNTDFFVSELKRMCASYVRMGCNGCPIENECPHYFVGWNFDIKSRVMEWSRDNPVVRYASNSVLDNISIKLDSLC